MNTILRTSVLYLALAWGVAAVAHAQEKIDVRFAKGASSAQIKGQIQGQAYRDYRLGAAAGQAMTVSMSTSNTAAYFNVLPPGSNDVADFIGSTSGNTYRAMLAKSGTYTIRVYLMRSAGRRNEVAAYTLKFAIAGKAASGMGAARANDAKVKGTPYHATGQVQCSMGSAPARPAWCELGVIRGRMGYAEVHVTPHGGLERVLMFAGDKVTSTQGNKVVDTKRGDEWQIIVNDREHYVIPEAVVVGG
ncbi:hypothetical protein ACFPOA_12680 [Lysobacter niabensis]|uniref:hypothetical protein n=1 Tax=Agrilutibacter niabensis TaxID=380628 RepID=UPI00360F4D9B